MKIMKVMSMLLVCSALLLTGCGEKEGVNVVETEAGVEASVDVSVIDKFEAKYNLTFEEGDVINLMECIDFPDDIVAGVEHVKFQWTDGLWYGQLRASGLGEQTLDAVVTLADGRTFDTKVTYTVVGGTAPAVTPAPTATEAPSTTVTDSNSEYDAFVAARRAERGVKETVIPDYTGMTLNELITAAGGNVTWIGKLPDGTIACRANSMTCPIGKEYYDIVQKIMDDPTNPNPANVLEDVMAQYADVIKVDGKCIELN